AELDEHAQLVDEAPVLGQASVDDPPDVDLGPRRELVRRRHAHVVALHGAPGGQAMDDLVAALDRVLDRVAEIRERLLQLGHDLLEALARRRDARHGGVLDVIRRVDLVDELELVAVEDLERDPLDHLRGFRGHGEPPVLGSAPPWRVQVRVPVRREHAGCEFPRHLVGCGWSGILRIVWYIPNDVNGAADADVLPGSWPAGARGAVDALRPGAARPGNARKLLVVPAHASVHGTRSAR